MPFLALPGRDRRWLALVALCAGVLMIILDQTIVTVALPSIQADLGFSEAALAWVINAYLVPFGGLLLLAGRFGDLVGRKRVFLAGLAVFTTASLLCGLSTSQAMLVASRFVQGIGGAMTSAVSLGIIVAMFPRPGERARALGVYTAVAATGGSIGLLAGGVLTQVLDWHWVFLVNLPIGIAVGLAAAGLLETDRGIGLGQGADTLGAALVTAGLMLGVYTIVEVPQRGWGSAQTVLCGLVSLGLLAVFVGRQATAARPLLPLRLFLSRTLSGTNLVQALMMAGLFGFFFPGTLFLQRVLACNPTQVGLAFLPVPIASATCSLGVSARLITRFGPRAVLLPGLALVLASLLALSRATASSEYLSHLLPAMLLNGVGVGLSFPALTSLAMASVAKRDAGLASGLLNTAAQVGGALGLAALATLSSSRTEHLLALGQSAAAALADGYRLAWASGAGVVAAALLITATVITTPPTSEAHEAIAPDESLDQDAMQQEAA